MPFHLDWVAGFLSLLGMYIVGKKVWWGWLINIVNLSLLVYINTRFRLWGFLPVNAVMAVIFAKPTPSGTTSRRLRSRRTSSTFAVLV